MRKIKFVCYAIKWHDRVNGNTYHSVRIERMTDGKSIVSDPMVYGYDDQYRYTALKVMAANKWLPVKYRSDDSYLYERENNYPIIWNCRDGLKREMISNVF